jgi:hypothetical protein
LLLAAPVGLGGWLGAKLALAAMAGALAAAIVWVASARLGVAARIAAPVVLAFGAVSPLVAYGTQVYPELPAALAVTFGVGALIGPRRRHDDLVLVLAVVALPWLGIKYVGVAGMLATIGLVRAWTTGGRRASLVAAGALVAAGLVYVVAHRALYGGWTVYAAGDHFVGGEHTVIGTEPDYAGRSQRLVGLVLDRGFGLAAWAPAWLLAVPALAALLRSRPRATWVALALPFAAGWATATWVALTMHGWWWPGRQTVVVLPCLVLAVAWWTSQLRDPVARRVRAALALLTAAAVAMWGWLLVDVFARRVTLIVDFERTRSPLYRAWRVLLPDYRDPTSATVALTVIWLAALAALAIWGWRSTVPINEEMSCNDVAGWARSRSSLSPV